MVDGLAKDGAGAHFEGPEPAVGVSTAAIRGSIRKFASDNHDTLWQNLGNCRQIREFGINRDSKRAEQLLRLSRNTLRAVVCLLTGHGGFNKHLRVMGLSETSICPLCQQEEDIYRVAPFMRMRSSIFITFAVSGLSIPGCSSDFCSEAD